MQFKRPNLHARPGGGLVPAGRLLSLLALATVAACSDTPFDPAADPLSPAEARLKGGVEALAPTDGERIAGATVFEAHVNGASLSSYEMTWKVDNGQENAMWDAEGHKQAGVDVSGWSWRGDGPYGITFIARDRRGRPVGTASVNLWVDRNSASPTGLEGMALWVDPDSNARRTADGWRQDRPEDAEAMDLLAGQPQADWFGDWNQDIRATVDARTTLVAAAGAVPLFVAYNIPLRDCNSYSGGGAGSASDYRAWVRGFADGLAGRQAVVVLEPDALALMDCLDAAQREERLELLRDAVGVLTAQGALVYLDAGHARWHPPATIAEHLRAAGVAGARGFALNVSNFVADAETVAYGEQLSALLGGVPFVIDSSRSGLGADPSGAWCNPEGRALGTPPTTVTAHERVDAFLWIKRPGESDGTCNGGPPAGTWWPEYALDLAQRAPWASG